MSHSDLAFLVGWGVGNNRSLWPQASQPSPWPHRTHYFSVGVSSSSFSFTLSITLVWKPRTPLSVWVQAESRLSVWEWECVWVGCETRRDKVARVCVKEAIADVRSNHTRLWKIHVHTKTKLLTWNKERQMSHPMQNQLHRLVLDGWLTGWYDPPSPALLLSQEQIKVEPTDNTEG